MTTDRSPLAGAALVAASFLAGGVPLSNIAARRLAGADLRQVGSGTVSGTGLFTVGGFRPLAIIGPLEVAKGALGPLLAGRARPALAAAAASAAIAGHNFSPFLRGAGGRGLAPALGATLVLAPEGTALLAAGLAAGRAAREATARNLPAPPRLRPRLASRATQRTCGPDRGTGGRPAPGHPRAPGACHPVMTVPVAVGPRTTSFSAPAMWLPAMCTRTTPVAEAAASPAHTP